MNEQKKVSIIVPVYKVEQYLEECIISLINQTYSNLQIFLIDDASPDRCPQICDIYANNDSRILVIHKENGGAASARNCALDCITGEYIAFVDSDDYVEPNYIELLVDRLEKNDADISVCSFEHLYRNGAIIKGYQGTMLVMSQIEFLKRFLTDWTCGLLWNKLFKRELLEDIRFPEGHRIDDEFFTYRLVMNAKKIILFDDILYKYRIRSSSVMNASKREGIILDKILYLEERYDTVSLRYPQLLLAYTEDLADSIIWLRRETVFYHVGTKYVDELFKKRVKQILLSEIGIKRKIAFILSYFCGKKQYVNVGDDASFDLFE